VNARWVPTSRRLRQTSGVTGARDVHDRKGNAMADKIHGFLPATFDMPTDRQRLFVRYFIGVLIDLVVLNLFNEYSDNVHVSTFTMSLLAAILLQALLKLTIAVEHMVGGYFKRKPGGLMKFLRFFFAWLVLFLSKFVILEALSFVFGDSVLFEGVLHGLVTLIIVVVVMLVAEELVVKIYRGMA
jgi:hypothetical protein